MEWGQEGAGARKRGGDPLHIWDCGGEERLLAHVGSTEHAGSTQAMVFLGFGEEQLNGFLA